MTRADPARVARRHMAALFEPPPRVLKDVVEWASAVYAGHILAFVEERMDRKPDETPKRFNQTQKYVTGEALSTALNKLTNKVLRIPAGPKKDFVIKRVSDMDRELAGNAGVDFEDDSFHVMVVKKGGRATFPRVPLEGSPKYRLNDWGDVDYDELDLDVQEWARGVHSLDDALDEVLPRLEKALPLYGEVVVTNPRENTKSKWLVEYELLRREVKKYTSKSKRYKNRARTTLPIDLSGWKYLKDMPSAEVEQKLVDANFTAFTCILNFRTHTRRSGLWTGDTMEIDVVTGGQATTVKEFREGLQSILDTARHESIHLGQTALGIVKETGGAGLPSDSIQPKGERERWRRLPHARRSVEFYTRLPDEVSEFKQRIKSIPLPSRRGYLRDWTEIREFFAENRKHNPPLWKKLVGEFLAAIEREGIFIPSFKQNISPNAEISLTATLGPDVAILGNAVISDNAQILGKSVIKDNAEVAGNAVVTDAVISGNAFVNENAQVRRSQVSGNAIVNDNAVVEGKARVEGDATVGGDARVKGAIVGRNAIIGGTAQILGGIWTYEKMFEGQWRVAPQPIDYKKFKVGDVVRFTPRANRRGNIRGNRWAIIGEYLGQGWRQPTPTGIERRPHRYALWVDDGEGYLDFIGDWDDFDVSHTIRPTPRTEQKLRDAWARYAA